MTKRGFTLLELLIAISILVVIVAVVYASFASVTDTMAVARVRTEEMRLRQFLERSFRTNLTSVYVDRGFEQQVFQFVGVNDETRDGPCDSLRFVSTNALMGGRALPGDFKEVRYEPLGGAESFEGLDLAADKDDDAQHKYDADPQQRKLEATETPLLASNAQAVDAESGNLDVTQSTGKDPLAPTYEAPSWEVPIRTIDFAYYDGEQWVEEWDSMEQGRLPWCVRVSINFARTEEEIARETEQHIDIVESPDFEVVVPIPIAVGLQQDGRSQSQLEQAAADAADAAEEGGTGSTSGSGSSGGSGTSGSPGTKPKPKPPASAGSGTTKPGSGSVFGSGTRPRRGGTRPPE